MRDSIHLATEPAEVAAADSSTGTEAAALVPALPGRGGELAPPPLVPDHQMLRIVGHGAYGEVWLARTVLGEYRAVKIVRRHELGGQDRPFEREFEGIKRFEPISRSHPSQLAILHVGKNEAAGYFYYVMELADDANAQAEGREAASTLTRPPGTLSHPAGEGQSEGTGSALAGLDSRHYTPHTLRADLAAGRLPAARVVELGLALTEALEHLHQQGLVHRDVKPSNIIFVRGRPKLADIGLLTETGDVHSIVGTEGYLPPEGPGTPQADVFALGKVLYEAATGLDRRQFPQLPPDLRGWPDTKLVFELNEILLRACAKDPVRRYQSAEEMHRDLALLQRGRSVKRRRIWEHRLGIGRKTGFAIAAVALAAAGGVLFWQTIARNGGPAAAVAGEDANVGTHNAKAAQSYRLGLPGLRRGTTEGFRQALASFTAATDADPKFAAAYARLFEIHLMSEDHGVAIIEGKTEQLNELSARLAKVAPTNAETHAALAVVRFVNEWKWKEAENEFKQALNLDPDCRMALTYYGYFLTRQRRAGEARPLLERALQLDPTSPLITKFLGHCEFVARHFEKALWFYLHASELEPAYPSGHYWAGRVYLAMTNYPQALDEFEQQELSQGFNQPETHQRYRNLREALEKGGQGAYWRMRIDSTDTDEPWAKTPYRYAERFARLGDKPQALVWLEKALAQKDSMENLLADEFWDDFRDEPKFKGILKSVGLISGLH